MQLIPLRLLMPRFLRKRLVNRWNRVLQLEQEWRERRFYRQFVRCGDLVFDVGANTGNKTGAFLSLGARVVAIEPNPWCTQQIDRKFGRASAKGLLHIERVAAASSPGTLKLCVFDANPELTSGSERFVDYAREYVQESGRTIETQAITLDELVSRYGLPTFLKIDVEGMDADVLRGLSQRPRFLSFEYHSSSSLWEDTRKCFAEAKRLGFSEVNLTDMAQPHLMFKKWLGISTAESEIYHFLGDRDRWGDVIVR